jgi:glycosyltransferase involved in cell wall biosynthesis
LEKIPLSVAIITNNEEENIRLCLQSVAFAAQIVLVDSGSTDATLSIARDFGCEIYSEEWQGFGPQKQSAIEKCHEPWILVLDADERITADAAVVIKKIVTDSDREEAGFSFPRKNYFQGRWIKHAGWWPDRIIRLFRKDAGRISTAVVHESVEVQGTIGDLDVAIEHYTESRLSKIIQKIDRYSTLGAHTAFKEGKKSSTGGAFLRAMVTFVQDYFLRLGILDGMPGLTLAVTDSVNKFFKYAKLNELIKINRGGGVPTAGIGCSFPKDVIPPIRESIQSSAGEGDARRRGK